MESRNDKRKVKGEWWVNWRSLVDVRIERGIPRLVLHEKYERRVKLILRVTWLIGVLGSLAALGPVGGIVFSLALSAVEQFLERAVFLYTTIVVTPVPEFSISMDEITAMAFGWPETPQGNHPDMAGFCFERPALAEQFFALLRRWNYGQREDRDNNIQLSFVWPKRGDGYYVCMFPKLRRKAVEDRFEQLRKVDPRKKEGREPQELFMIWTMRKTFYGGGKALRQFLERQQPDRPFWLQAFLSEDGIHPTILFDVKPILKWHFRTASESELKPHEPEYWLVVKPGEKYRREVVGSEK